MSHQSSGYTLGLPPSLHPPGCPDSGSKRQDPLLPQVGEKGLILLYFTYSLERERARGGERRESDSQSLC